MDPISETRFAEKGRLWIERPDGAAVGHRCMIVGDRPALHLFDGRRRRCHCIKILGQSELLAAPVDHVVPAMPLSPAEVAEYSRLDADLAGTFGDARLLTRFNGLRLRALHFGELAA